MTVSTAYSVLSYAGNGATTAFAVTWPFFTGTLVVTLVSSTGVETVQTLTTHYTVAGGTDANGLPATGTVTMLTAPASGTTLRITRSTTKTQASTWTESDPFPQKTVEAALDKLTLLAQEAGSPGTVNDGIGGDVMELVTSGATNYWDAESQIIRGVADGQEDTDAVNYAQLNEAVAGGTFTQTGSGAVERSWLAKMREVFVSVKDFGAVGDGSTNDTAACQAAIDSGATNIYFPAGTYRITSTLLVSERVGLHIYGDSGGSNGLGSSKIYWAGSANGVIFKLYSSSSCTIERLAFQGILGGLPSNPGTGIWVTALNADGASHWNVFRDISVSAIGGSPGYGILIGSATNDDIATNTFENVLVVGGAISVVQNGTQTVNNLYKNVQCLDYTSKGMWFEHGDIRVDKCSYFGVSTATADIEVGTGALWAAIRDTYHEILSDRPGGAVGVSFPSGSRSYLSELHNIRILWNRASGTVINYLQAGPVSIHNSTFDTSAGGGTLTLTNSAAAPPLLSRFGNHVQSGLTWAVSNMVAFDESQSVDSPQGRLTLTTATPVMTSPVSGATTVYYTPYTGRMVPLYNGSRFAMHDIGGELSQATTDSTKSPSACTTNSTYDLFVWIDAGTYRCTRGPAWSTATSRGTGAGTTELERVQGVLLNKVAITNGPAANRGTYVGSIRTNGSSQVDFIYGAVAAGGTEGVFGVWNMYNRVLITSRLGDSADSWVYSTAATFRAANNSSTMRVSILQGLQEDTVDLSYEVPAAASGSSAAYIGIGVDSTTACTGPVLLTTSLSIVPISVRLVKNHIGWQFFAPLEAITGTSATFYGDNGAAAFCQNMFSVSFRA